VAGVASSIHINSILLFSVFPFFRFSFSYFLLSSLRVHPIIFIYLYICIFAYFQNCSDYEKYAFRQEDIL
jgi:hypothetical protein